MTQDSAESAPGDLRSQAGNEVHTPADRCSCLYMQGQGRAGQGVSGPDVQTAPPPTLYSQAPGNEQLWAATLEAC